MSSSDDPLIETIYGLRPASMLEKREGVFENENERTAWIEYWLGADLVHRSAHVTLKKWPEGMGALAAEFGS